MFNDENKEEYSEQHYEYPPDPPLEEGQWFDICRLPIDPNDHLIERDSDWLTEYMLNELNEFIPGE